MGSFASKGKKTKRVASIDIGTNTILMLIADVDESGNIYPVADEHSIARLGEGVNETGMITDLATERAIEILKNYRHQILRLKVEKVFAVGTSALRDARNSLDVLVRLEQPIDTKIEVIDGELEAYLSFIGTVIDESYSVVLDIGGGSTEIIAGYLNKIQFKQSLRVGAVRLTENFFPVHPPSNNQISKAREEIGTLFSMIDKGVIKGNIFAVAGTPTTLASIVLGLHKYDRNKVDGYHLELFKIEILRKKFEQMTIEEIVDKLYVHPRRADVIFAGTLILEEFCKSFDLSEVIVSDKGLRYGVIKQKIGEIF
jgi:exopolyphosphatase/guanosine-5'-triphosphate,3'-diphosphate pyrophosphatase